MVIAIRSRLLILTISIFFNTITAHIITQIDDQYKLGIINGHPINITEVPFFAIYRPVGRLWSCGASIVHEQFLVTACHCVKGIDPGEVAEIVVGTDKIEEGEKHSIDKAICHPKYNLNPYSGIDYDIAVLKLTNKLTLSESVNIIKMADSGVVLKEGDVFDTMGFGWTNMKTQNLSHILLKTEVPFVEREKCVQDLSKFDFKITQNMICAGGGTKTPCHGDSGGPLLFNGVLVGAVSFGPYCEPNYPEVFAFIPAMRDFIDKTIEENL